jgi:succinate dehydrogenase / fumarate reductase, membrane anchor subunit
MINGLSLLKKGVAKTATSHWLMQRITAVILIPLSFRLIVFVDLCMNAPYQQTMTWMKSPLNTLSIEIWLLAAFYHAALGLQVVIEDYIANQHFQTLLIKVINLSFLFLAVAAMFFIFRIM